MLGGLLELMPSAFLRHWLLFGLALLASLLLACGPGAPVQNSSAAPAGARALQDIQDVSDLQVQFNQDLGKPRLLLLVSPT
jgi:hypothetical protein